MYVVKYLISPRCRVHRSQLLSKLFGANAWIRQGPPRSAKPSCRFPSPTPFTNTTNALTCKPQREKTCKALAAWGLPSNVLDNAISKSLAASYQIHIRLRRQLHRLSDIRAVLNFSAKSQRHAVLESLRTLSESSLSRELKSHIGDHLQTPQHSTLLRILHIRRP